VTVSTGPVKRAALCPAKNSLSKLTHHGTTDTMTAFFSDLEPMHPPWPNPSIDLSIDPDTPIVCTLDIYAMHRPGIRNHHPSLENEMLVMGDGWISR